MSIASALTALNTDIENARTAIINKGGTVTANGGSSQLATDIATIPSGGSFIGIPREISNGTIQLIQANHTYTVPDNVTDIGGYAYYSAFYSDKKLTRFNSNNVTTISGVYGMTYACQSATGLTTVDMSNLRTLIGTQCMASAFYGCSALTNVDLSSFTTASGTNVMSTCFRNCTGLTELNFPSLVTINGSSAFSGICNGCTNLVTVTFPNVTTITGSNVMLNAFQNNTSLVNIGFPKLKTIGANTSPANYGHLSGVFNGCTQITTMTFPELEAIYCNGGTSAVYGSFANNTYIQKLYFPKLDFIGYGTGAASNNRHACKNVFAGCTALTELHFAEDNQSAIEASDGYSTAWGRGAGNVTIYFDL